MTKLYGGSDDLIEIDGDISDEIGHYDSGRAHFVASDGTKGTILYDGEWRIDFVAGTLFDRIINSVGDDNEHTDKDAIGCASYSDVIIFKPGLQWIKVNGKKYNNK